MEKITGIGGFFFRAKDPKALAAWYETHFGINQCPESYDQESWEQDEGPTVFAPFPQDTDYFGKRENMWMINFRVRDLDAMIVQLRSTGITVEPDPQNPYPNGTFARLTDPEGNRIELWQPA
jgi:predicted enzyme related to lactoylglutathione lyase